MLQSNLSSGVHRIVDMLYRGGVGPSTYSSATAASASTPAATGRKRSLKDIYEKVSDEEEEGGVYVKYIQFVHNFYNRPQRRRRKMRRGTSSPKQKYK